LTAPIQLSLRPNYNQRVKPSVSIPPESKQHGSGNLQKYNFDEEKTKMKFKKYVNKLNNILI